MKILLDQRVWIMYMCIIAFLEGNMSFVVVVVVDNSLLSNPCNDIHYMQYTIHSFYKILTIRYI